MRVYNKILLVLIPVILLSVSGFSIIQNEPYLLNTENRYATTIKDIKEFNMVEDFFMDQFPKRIMIIGEVNNILSNLEKAMLARMPLKVQDLKSRYLLLDEKFYIAKYPGAQPYSKMIDFFNSLLQIEDVDIYFINAGRKEKHTDIYRYYGLSNDYDKVEEEFKKAVPQGITVIDYNWGKDKFLKYFYSTDHHTNIYGGIDVYKLYMEAKGNKNYFIDFPIKKYDGAEFYGSDSKAINMYDIFDEFYALDFQKIPFKYIVNGAPYKFRNISSADIPALNKNKSNYYGVAFGGDFGKLEIINPNKPNGRRLLIIGDSYSNNLNHLLAYEYSYVMDIDTRYYEKAYKQKANIKELVKENKIDDILIYTGVFRTDTIDIKN